MVACKAAFTYLMKGFISNNVDESSKRKRTVVHGRRYLVRKCNKNDVNIGYVLFIDVTPSFNIRRSCFGGQTTEPVYRKAHVLVYVLSKRLYVWFNKIALLFRNIEKRIFECITMWWKMTIQCLVILCMWFRVMGDLQLPTWRAYQFFNWVRHLKAHPHSKPCWKQTCYNKNCKIHIFFA